MASLYTHRETAAASRNDVLALFKPLKSYRA
jgi:hypothetical protein